MISILMAQIQNQSVDLNSELSRNLILITTIMGSIGGIITAFGGILASLKKADIENKKVDYDRRKLELENSRELLKLKEEVGVLTLLYNSEKEKNNLIRKDVKENKKSIRDMKTHVDQLTGSSSDDVKILKPDSLNLDAETEQDNQKGASLPDVQP